MATKKETDPVVTSLREAAKSATWKIANYKKTFGKFPGSYVKILAVMNASADEHETEREFEDTLLGWVSSDIKVAKGGLEFELDAGPHIRRFVYTAKSKKWTSYKVNFDEGSEEEFEDDEYDGII